MFTRNDSVSKMLDVPFIDPDHNNQYRTIDQGQSRIDPSKLSAFRKRSV